MAIPTDGNGNSPGDYRQLLELVVGQSHVGREPEMLADDIRARFNGAVKSGHMTRGFKNALVRIALQIHSRNGRIYNQVTRG